MFDSMPASPAGQGTLVARYDPIAQIIRTKATGNWSMDLLNQHMEEMQTLIRKMRSGSSGVRVLSDLSQAAVQTPEIALRIERLTAETYRAEDRIAVIVASSLLKMQIRRVIRNARFEAFLSRSAAETWLKAYDADQAPSDAVRSPRRLTSIVTTIHRGGDQIAAAKVLNVSDTGLLVEAKADLEIGEPVATALPGLGAVAGKVARLRGRLAGIRFDAPIPLDRLVVA